MDIKTRKQTAKALMAAAKALSAGTVKHPERMVETIMRLVDSAASGWTLYFINKTLPDLQKQLAVFYPSEDTKAPAPKISPALRKMAKAALEDVESSLVAHKRGELEEEIRVRNSPYTRLRLFVSGYHGHLSMRSLGLDRLPSDMLRKVKKAAKIKKIEDMDDEDLRVFTGALLVPARSGKYSKAAQSGVYKLLDYQKDREAVKKRAGAGGQVELSPSDQRQADKLEKQVSGLQKLNEFLLARGVKASKRKPGPKRAVEHLVKVDLRGLPSKYPIDVYEQGLIDTIKVNIIPARANFSGAWDQRDKSLDIIVGTFPMNPAAWDDVLGEIRSTIKHELEHMVQYIIKDSLKLREQQKVQGPLHKDLPGPWEQAGSPYPSGSKIREPRNLGERVAMLKNLYPSADKNELYYLSPIEFFPQVGSAVTRFIQSVRRPRYGDPIAEEDIRKQLPDLWRAHTGAGPSRTGVYPDPFFDALKTYNRKMWGRAISEGWLKLKEQLK